MVPKKTRTRRFCSGWKPKLVMSLTTRYIAAMANMAVRAGQNHLPSSLRFDGRKGVSPMSTRTTASKPRRLKDDPRKKYETRRIGIILRLLICWMYPLLGLTAEALAPSKFPATENRAAIIPRTRKIQSFELEIIVVRDARRAGWSRFKAK